MKIPIYKYSKITLEFVKINVDFKKILIFLGIQTFISIILLTILSFLFSTPKERRLIRELNALKREFLAVDRKSDELLTLLDVLERKDSVIYQSLFAADITENKFIENGYISNYKGEFSDTIVKIGNKLSKIEMLMEKANYRFKNIITQVSSSNAKLNHMPAIQPISNKTLERTSSGFGLRIHPIYRIRKMHQGMDFVAAVGTPIYATGDGVIEMSSPSYFGYGGFIKINHDYGYKTAYGHLSKILVKNNQSVKRGDVIGLSGNTGISTGAHLHYEVIYQGKPVNPINFYFHDLNGEQYTQMINISNSIEKSMD